MSAIHSPQEKKKKAYDCDRRSKGKYDKQFRKSWPRKKRLVNRIARHKANAASGRIRSESDEDLGSGIEGPKTLRKWYLSSLRETIAQKLARRKASHGAKKARRLARESE